MIIDQSYIRQQNLFKQVRSKLFINPTRLKIIFVFKIIKLMCQFIKSDRISYLQDNTQQIIEVRMYTDGNQPFNLTNNDQLYQQTDFSDRGYGQTIATQNNNYNNFNTSSNYNANTGANNNNNNNYNPNHNYNNDSINDSLPIIQGQPYQATYGFPQRESFQIQNNFYSNNINQNQMPQKTYILKDPQQVDPLGHLENGLEGAARKGFIKKVYSILALQLLITVGMCFASYYSRSFLDFQVNQYWLMIVVSVFAIIVQITIFCCPSGREHPKNLILLAIFTFCEAYMVSFITAIVAYNDGGAQIVVIAAIMTLGVASALTLYAIFTRTDFTIKWGIIIVIIVAMLFLGIFSWIAWTPFLNVLYCSLGLILFGIYIVIDTQLIIGGKRLQLSMDEYVVGALLLYIDIIQIFLYILMILGGGRR